MPLWDKPPSRLMEKPRGFSEVLALVCAVRLAVSVGWRLTGAAVGQVEKVKDIDQQLLRQVAIGGIAEVQLEHMVTDHENVDSPSSHVDTEGSLLANAYPPSWTRSCWSCSSAGVQYFFVALHALQHGTTFPLVLRPPRASGTI